MFRRCSMLRAAYFNILLRLAPVNLSAAILGQIPRDLLRAKLTWQRNPVLKFIKGLEDSSPFIVGSMSSSPAGYCSGIAGLLLLVDLKPVAVGFGDVETACLIQRNGDRTPKIRLDLRGHVVGAAQVVRQLWYEIGVVPLDLFLRVGCEIVLGPF